jgi:hypothetical protein
MMFSPIFGVIQCPNLIVTYTSSTMNFIQERRKMVFPELSVLEIVGEQWLCCPRNIMFLEKDHHCVVAWGRCEEDDNIQGGVP